MTNEEVIKRLKGITLPRIISESHCRELRESLLNEYARIKISADKTDLFGFLRSRPLVWKTVPILLALVFITVGTLWATGILVQFIDFFRESTTPPITFAPGTSGSASYVSSFQDMSELCNSSDVIVVGTVERVIEVVRADYGPDYVYDARSAFRVDQVLKGEIGKEIVLTKMAFKENDVWVEGMNVDPPFVAGERWVLFLHADLSYNNLGPWGRYKIIDDKVYSMNRVANDNNAYGHDIDINGVPLADFVASINQTLDSVVLTFTDSRITWAIAPAVRFNPGGFAEVNVNLSTGKHGPADLTYSIKRVEGKESNIEVPIPEQMTVSINPAQLITQPHNQYISTLYIQTTDIPSGTYWIRVEYQLGKLISGYRVLMVNINP